jgi:hypothetical protein
MMISDKCDVQVVSSSHIEFCNFIATVCLLLNISYRSAIISKEILISYKTSDTVAGILR